MSAVVSVNEAPLLQPIIMAVIVNVNKFINRFKRAAAVGASWLQLKILFIHCKSLMDYVLLLIN